MRLFKHVLLSVACAIGVVSFAAAAPFVVKHIQVMGNQRVSDATILNYIPIKMNTRLNAAQQAKIIRDLYKTGFFKDIQLLRRDNTLVVKVVERETIGSIAFSGNSLIPKDKINDSLKNAGLVRGQVFNRQALQQIREALNNAYIEQGRYNADITTTVTPQSRNRVAIDIKIVEGPTAKVKQITIIGNHAFSAHKLIDQFTLTTPKLWSFITGGNQYSRDKFASSLKALRDFYFDHGHVRFRVLSSEATLTPDKKWVYLVVKIKEGPVYNLRHFDVGGELLGNEALVRRQLSLKSGGIFSQSEIQAAADKIATFFGDRGFAFASIRPIPNIDDKNRTVDITFFVNPGRRVYVRRISFSGNTKTHDNVLRRELRQMEGGLISVSNIKESVRRLKNLSYIGDVNVQTKPDPVANDQVDLDVQVKETSSAQVMASVGYGTNGIVLGASLNQQNFMGTGNYVGINFNRNDYVQTYSFNFAQPYYTPNGVSRSFNLYYNRYTPDQLNLASYSYDSYGAGVSYGIPLTDHSTLSAGIGLEHLNLKLGDNPPQVALDFIGLNDRNYDPNNPSTSLAFNHAILTTAWNYRNYDQYPFPTKGVSQEVSVKVSAPLGNPKLQYAKISYLGHYYQPLYHGFIMSAMGQAGYGHSYGATRTTNGLPFFENFYAGGIDSVRGYETNTLGPRDSRTNDSLGGNQLLTGSLELIFPNYISENLRTSLFVDGGNVYNNTAGGIKLNDLRYATGIAFKWRIPMIGQIQFSLAKALNPKSGDRTEFFAFTLGAGF